MPRSASKSHADKRKPKSSAKKTTPPPQDLEEEDITPGHLTQAQWTDMLTQDEADETVGEIKDELCSEVMKGCLKVDIERQLAPFCVSWAKSCLIQTVEHHFLCLDEGDGPEELSRTEDSEPVPVIPDAWAQGCVPVLNTTHQPLSASPKEADTGQVPAQREPRFNQECEVMAQTNSFPRQATKETNLRRPVNDKHCKALSPLPPPKTNRKKKQQFNLPPKIVPCKLLPSLSCSTKKDVEVESKSKGQSVSNRMTGSISQHKNSQPIPRLDPSCLPQHYITPQFEIVDNNNTKPDTKKPSGLSRLELRKNKQQTEQTVKSLQPLTSSKDQPEKFKKRNEEDVYPRKLSLYTQRKEHIVPGPLRLDTTVLAKGVSLLDPQAVEMNPLKCIHPPQSTKLRPIRSNPALPLLSVDEFTSGPPPLVTPLFQSKS
ncbi:uncharacterized protein C2orf81 homolog [Brachyistius frenatus]|uniref:uncharacterized protein C2orf81 homolog n=1 Tax=Brachyistius frenatus TaxID=100188 RepID=UPI0037E85071